MLVDTKEMLLEAQTDRYAIGAFNTYNLEITLGIIHAAEAMQSPVIIQVGASALAYGGEQTLSALTLAAARSTDIPVAVHLDHARDHNLLTKCLESGFTSVMFDGSALSLQENIKQTKQAVMLAHKAGVGLEAELGALSGEEDGGISIQGKFPYTDPVEAGKFSVMTGIDSLAIAIGNQHGYYQGKPHLDLERLAEIRKSVGLPLVLHGASGIPDEVIRKSISLGICKINVNTDLRKAFFTALCREISTPSKNFPLPQMMGPAINSVKDVVISKVILFGSQEKVK